MRKAVVALGFAAAVLGADVSASLACSEPSFYENAPDGPSTSSRPDVPFCLSEYSYSGKHSCEDWEIRSYQGEVEEYVGRLQSYLNEAATFARNASNFASEVESYARCEADEVASQHE